ncbi:MAG: 30S ribosomal protein S1 [Deltaproteobacteria bacterium]|nr:30S ribosomal protein S1 [Deltaproteobacteria bacterium]
MEKPTTENELTENKILETEEKEVRLDAVPAEEDTMSDAEDISSDTDEMVDVEDFTKLYEESLKSIQEGEVLVGEVVQVDKDYVLVDIGYKSEGQISIDEFRDPDGNVSVKVGDKVDVLLERKDNEEGGIVLSKEKAAKIKIWDNIKKIYENDETIKGKILSRVKGGFSVDVGLQAFLPGSQVDLRPVRDMNSLIGTEHEFKIVKYNKRRGNIVLSRRALLEAQRMAQREETLRTLEEGAILEGKVKNITNYGLFIDLGGIDGLVHITDMSWGRVGHPSELYKPGDDIKVKVLSFDRESQRVSLGIKQLKPDPWDEAAEKYPVGTKITGRVVNLKDYGAFVEVEPGIEGLIHVSEMSWTRKVRHPSQVLSVGDTVNAVVLDIDISKKRISLGMKQVEPNPWDAIEEKYPVGTIIEGKIKNITDFGIFVGIDEGIDGLVHISDISWTKRIKHPSEIYKKGQEVQAIVLNIDKENERFSLGIKQLTSDPWDEIPYKYQPGVKITGTVTSVTDFGIFLQLEEGVEGLVHVSEVPSDGQKDPMAGFKVNDVVEAKVINVSREEKKIGLSLKKLDSAKEKGPQTSYKNYINNRQEATSNLGELLREEMITLERNVETSKDQQEEEKTIQSED